MIIDEIVANKKAELDRLKTDFPVKGLIQGLKMRIKQLPPTRDFAKAIKGKGIKIIAEVKKASPSKGVIKKDFKPVEIARTYEANGAAAISVLTEEKHFHGHIDYLREIKDAVSLPILRKDFIFDEYQIYESRAAGADAILLIASILEGKEINEFIDISRSLGMDCLVEVHDENELDKVLSTKAKIIGINNRDLKTFKTDVKNTLHLIPKIPNERIVVSESGINSYNDIDLLKRKGVHVFLVGEAIMREKDMGKKLKELRGIK
ncbi:MAG: indole-3-glycerol phosphate synthase TrpC [Deltaproteobacteria bacterium]|nr:indole-3-glycerol phosphate synthase TrpC [Deltaproteobacteria bacterium]